MSEILIYGIHPIQTILDTHPERLLQIFVSSHTHQKRLDFLLSQARTAGIAVQQVAAKTVDAWFDTTKHQGIAARIRAKPLCREETLLSLVPGAKQPLLLILDGIQDPHNLGACLRTADAVGVDAVIIPKHHTALITAVVHKVACGAAETVSIVPVANLARCLSYLKKQGLWCVGTTLTASRTIYAIDLSLPLALIVGTEGRGLRALTEKHCDFIARIPMQGQVTSLNVSVAAAVCLYEALRQRSFRYNT